MLFFYNLHEFNYQVTYVIRHSIKLKVFKKTIQEHNQIHVKIQVIEEESFACFIYCQ